MPSSACQQLEVDAEQRASILERAAIARLRDGSLDALDVLYDRYAPAMLRLARYLSGSVSDAEDIVHDVFVALPTAIRSYEHRGQLGAWLRRLVVNRSIDHRRAVARRRTVPLGAATVHAATATPVAADHEYLDRAIATLPDALRVVFVLRAVEGHSHAEIAAQLGLRTGTVEVRYFRAVRALRAYLKETEC
jgi:RNA polymerase sigma-70 factor (ECF subfamily)